MWQRGRVGSWRGVVAMLVAGVLLAGCGGGDLPQTQITGRAAQRAVALATYQAHRLALEAGWFALAQTAPSGFGLPAGVRADGFSWLVAAPPAAGGTTWRVPLYTDARRQSRAGTLTFSLPAGARAQTTGGVTSWHYPSYPATARMRVEISGGRRPLSGDVLVTWRSPGGAYDVGGTLRASGEGLVVGLRQRAGSDRRVSLGTSARFGGITVTPDLGAEGDGTVIAGPVRAQPFGWQGTMKVGPRPASPYDLSLAVRPGTLTAALSPAADSLLITYPDASTQRISQPFWVVWSR